MFLSVLLSLIMQSSFAQNNSPAPINIYMHEISQELDKLSPYLFKEEKFIDIKNEKMIKEYLTNLVTKFKTLKKHPAIKTPGFSFSRDQIEIQLSETVQIFKTHHKEYARHKLNSTLGLCISCHTQLPSGDKLKIFGSTQIDQSITDTFEKAEFYFVTRDFAKAMVNYDQFINSYTKSDERKFLDIALNHKLMYFMRIQRDKTAEAITSFKKNVLNKELPIVVREQIEEWIKELKVAQFFTLNGKVVSQSEMKKFLKEITKENENGPRLNLYSSAEVKDLRISGLLFEYLNAHPNSVLTPEILYNLAIIDKHMNFSLFYSLGDLYLIECMTKYARFPIAKSCYKEFEDEKILSYTGSAGTLIPEEVKKELASYKNKIWKGK